MRRLGPLLALLLPFLTGCAGAAAGTAAGTAAPPGPTGPELVSVTRESLTRTVVLPATVQAAPRLQLTAPAAGRYELDGSRVRFRLDTGRTGTLRLPHGVRVVSRLVPDGRHVPRNFPLAVTRLTGFGLVASLDRAATYQLARTPTAARGQVTQGPGPFACPLADRVPLVTGAAPGEAGAPGATLTCVIPGRFPVFAGQAAVMAVSTGSVHGVPALPVEAVAGSVGRGTVTVVDARGHRHAREVRLGLSDGTLVEVRSGLRVGDRVTVPGPDLPHGGTA